MKTLEQCWLMDGIENKYRSYIRRINIMTCWFCGVEESEESKAYQIEMFGDVEQNSGDLKEAVSFNKKLVVVPRCASCKARQAKAKRANVLAVVSLVVTLIFGGLGLLKLFPVIPIWAWGIAVGFFAGMIIEFLTVRHYAMKGIKSEHTARKRFEEVCELLSRGYEFGRAPKQHKVAELIIEED
jgi:hypothetical protein